MDLYIFDFDDTLAVTDSRVKVIRNGQEILMTSREFAHFPFNPSTDQLDFGDFQRAQGTLIKDTVAEMQRAMQDGHDVFIVTARAIAKPVEEFLTNEIGSHPPVIATAGSEGKTPWLKNQLNRKEYQRVVVYEDCKKNIRALKDVAEAAGITYSAMCILEDQSMVKSESRWRREDLLNEWDFREITKNFLRKTW
tara:strand:- start:115 stop:696 length:582 start_codon:yes stop_codon:yes gene_type:complete